MKHRFLSLAVLAGIALALLAPAQPAAADDSCPAGIDCVDCSQVFTLDPSRCIVPPEPPPIDPGMVMAPRGSERVPMPPLPPDMPADPAGDPLCLQVARGSSIFASDRKGPAYTFVVGARYCLNRTTGRIVSVTPVVPTPIERNDERVSIFFGPLEKNVTRIPAGGSVAEALVVYELDVNFFPFGVGGSQIQSYHHEFGVRIKTDPFLTDLAVPPVFKLTHVSG